MVKVAFWIYLVYILEFFKKNYFITETPPFPKSYAKLSMNTELSAILRASKFLPIFSTSFSTVGCKRLKVSNLDSLILL